MSILYESMPRNISINPSYLTNNRLDRIVGDMLFTKQYN